MAHTQMGRPTYEAPTREYTHKQRPTQARARRGTRGVCMSEWVALCMSGCSGL